MNIRTVNLNLLAVFEMIFQKRSISLAAQKLGMSQPAVSSALGRLRQVYQDPLFTRSPKGMLPTHRAKLLIQPIGKALGLIGTSFGEQTAFKPSECDLTFRVAMSDWLSLVLLPPLLELMKVAPRANLVVRNLTLKEMLDALEDNRLDVGISGQIGTAGIGKYRQKLYREHYCSIAWAHHPGIKAGKLTLKTFITSPHVLYSPQGSGPAAVDVALKRLGLQRRVVVRVAYSLALPILIQNSGFIATCPAPLGRIFSRLMDIQMFSPPVALPGHDMVQYWSKEKHTEPAHRWFRTLMADACRAITSP